MQELVRDLPIESIPSRGDAVSRREAVLTRLGAGAVSMRQAAMELGISVRQLRRIRLVYSERGSHGLIHGNTGRTPSNAIEPRTADLVLAVASSNGSGLSQQALTRLLNQEYGLSISRPSVHRILRRRSAGNAAGHLRVLPTLSWPGTLGDG